MNGSLPPSSNTAFFSCLPARLATAAPAPSLPVKVTARTRGSSINWPTRSPLISNVWKAPGSKPASRGVFQQADVAGHERGCREPNHLPEREIPGHHGQHRAEREIANEAAVGLGLDRLVAQELCGVLRVVAASQRAFFGFGDGGFQRLAHLLSHHLAVGALISLQDLGDLAHALRALREAKPALRLEGAQCMVEPALELGVCGFFERSPRLAAGGIDA